MSDTIPTDQTPTNAPQTVTVGRLCFDFQYRAERFAPEFQDFLTRHRTELDLPPDTDPGPAYLQRPWPDGLPVTAIISNISTDPKHSLWRIRPIASGPLAATYAANGQAPAFKAYRRQGTLVITGLDVVPHVPPRPFERLVSGQILINPKEARMSAADWAVLETLPRYRDAYARQVQPWGQYFDWLETLIHFGQGVVAYDGVDARDGDLRFYAKGLHLPSELGRLFRRETVMAAPVTESRSPGVWDPPEDRRPRLLKVGQVVSIKPVNERIKPASRPNASHRQSTPNSDEAPVQVAIIVQPQDADALSQEDVPPEGFLMTHIGSELKPLAGQRRGVNRLLKGWGHHPHLLECLMDIRNAAVPDDIPDVCSRYPELAKLNPEQRAAVNKAMAAPEVFVFLGPPGTGKTEVIASICWLMALAGGRVLVTSQSNLAVDNVLGRLKDRPEARPLRIARPDRVEEDGHRFLEKNAPLEWFGSVRKAVLAHIQRTEAFQLRIRTAEEALQNLRSVLSGAEDLRARISSTEQDLTHLRARRAEQQGLVESLQRQADQLARRRQALTDLVRWCSDGSDRME